MRTLLPALLLAVLAPALAQDNPSADEIVRSLKPAPRERSVQFVDPSAPEPEAALPKVSLTINFKLNSAQVDANGQTLVNTLGQALSSEALAAYRFEIAGHTDASGLRAKNLALSQSRAETVRQQLVAQFGIAPERLSAKGYGPDQLADAARPKSGKNRRVEIINLGPATP